MVEWNLADVGYLAGCLDCDGTITFSTRHRRGNQILIEGKMGFYNSHRQLLEKVQRIIGMGTIRGIKGIKHKHNVSYRLEVTNSKICGVLRAVAPHLARKKEQAEIVLEFYESRKNKPRGAPYEDEEWRMLEKVRALNKEGNNRGK